MNAFDELAAAATSSFASTTGYSMADFASFGYATIQTFIGGIIAFLQYNALEIVAWTSILIIVAFGLKLLTHGPFMRL
jgi:hypothetical protein